jgi:hypothetical protein
MKKTTVLLVTFGGPCSIEDVPRFMRNLMGCEPSPAVATQVSDRYNQVGGCSLPAITEEQARLLQAATENQFTVRIIKYSPSIENASAMLHGRLNACFFMLSPFTEQNRSSYTLRGYQMAAVSSGCCPYRTTSLYSLSVVEDQVETCDDDSPVFPHTACATGINSTVSQIQEAGSGAGASSAHYGLGWQSVPGMPAALDRPAVEMQ